MGRIAARLILWCLAPLLLLLAGHSFAAAGDLVPPPPPPPEVREGRTVVAPPRAGAPAPDDTDAAPAVSALPSSVSDAPRVGRGVLRLPPIPAGFNTYDAGWVRFVYHPSSRERVDPLIKQAEAVRHDLTERLGFPVLSDVRVQIARTTGEMATFAPSGAPYPEYAAGVAYSELGLVLLSLTPVHAGQEQDLGEVFRHELAHVALHDALNGQAVPRWFNEGFAVFASGESSYKRMKTLMMSTVGGSLIPLSELERTFPDDETKAEVAYAEAVDVLRFLVRREDLHRFRALITELREGKTFEQSVLDAYAVDLATLELEWRDDASRRYTFMPLLLSGTFFWVIALALAVWAWRRRKRRDKVTLQRWAREEAVEDLQRARLALRAEAARVHIVLTKSAELPVAQLAAASSSEKDIPVVEHDGSWHTLH
ncbi:MAG TPA: peptidase MA family metallohydrolase [Polyangiaceae bacterium]|nr:peptidase MA family metallohydrolase [Polyangiaceae bacterium]